MSKKGEPCINIDETVELLNNKNTTFEKMCEFVYFYIEEYQTSKQELYLKKLKSAFTGPLNERELDQQSRKILTRIEKDVSDFVSVFIPNSIDVVLDAKNEKRFKTKTGVNNFLSILCAIKEANLV